MIHYHRSFKSCGTAIIIVGIAFFVVLVLSLPELLKGKDYLSLILLFILGLAFNVFGILLKRWAHKNHKN